MCIPPKKARRTIVVLDFADDAEALRIAREIAAKTGSVVTLRDEDGAEIDTISPAKP
jgi:hypothetical protein